ncbi:hypothetical protein [Halodesulfovibrio sp.]|uniref:hypothetical protein n=1 Tax=Halodesulfovibrio sp. TaxID=1912772 RepID=UPI0025E55CFD|nr:hypothetical protein [Halodesulfovibrio sp.]MCT4625471.1 hypothetical protein [Halodesulfovibrio sp.]
MKFSKMICGLLFCLCFFSVVSTTNAKRLSSEELIDGCSSLVEILESKDEILSIISDISQADAMRAGVCRGALEEYARVNHCRGSLKNRASVISEEFNVGKSYQQLLKNTCW